MRTHRFFWMLLLVLLAVSPAWAKTAEDAYREARNAYLKLDRSEEDQKYRHQWDRVIAHFREVVRNHPGTTRSIDALYMTGKCQMRLYEVSNLKTDARDAIATFDRLADNHSRNSLADDALFNGAELSRGISDYPGAFLRYQRVIDEYPSGDMQLKAKQQLKQLDRLQPATQEVVAPKVPPPVTSPLPVVPTGQVELQGIRHWSNPSYTRVVIDLSQKTAYKANILASDAGGEPGYRLYVDLTQTQPAGGIQNTTPVADGLLSQIRVGAQPGKTRVVFDLVSLGDYKIFALSNPERLVVDIQADADAVRTVSPKTSTKAGPGQDEIAGLLSSQAQSPSTRPAPVMTADDDVFRIVVDAGHGGKDPGAIGRSGTQEKKIALALAKKLRTELKRLMKCEVILTRDRDVYLPLDERTAIANKVNADLFISIHANATRNRKAYGVETFFLNLSKEGKAAEVAARENNTTLQEVGNLEAILFDLMANAKINESSRLAAEIQRSLVKDLKSNYSHVKDLGVRQGPFYVLLGATMPSVLVETAFISHPREEKRLNSAAFQKRTARAIAKGVRAYAESMQLVSRR